MKYNHQKFAKGDIVRLKKDISDYWDYEQSRHTHNIEAAAKSDIEFQDSLLAEMEKYNVNHLTVIDVTKAPLLENVQLVYFGSCGPSLGFRPVLGNISLYSYRLETKEGS